VGKTIAMLVCLAGLASFALPIRAEEGLLVHYTFGEGSGAIVRDSSGLGNDGKIVGDARWVQEQ
jgi:hypothetical protein